MSDIIDLGYNHYCHWVPWRPNRDLNPQWKDTPDIARCFLSVQHLDKKGGICESGIHPDTPEVRAIFHPSQIWQVLSWDPLTLSPSLLCKRCGDHGHIRNGKWEPR